MRFIGFTNAQYRICSGEVQVFWYVGLHAQHISCVIFTYIYMSEASCFQMPGKRNCMQRWTFLYLHCHWKIAAAMMFRPSHDLRFAQNMDMLCQEGCWSLCPSLATQIRHTPGLWCFASCFGSGWLRYISKVTKQQRIEDILLPPSPKDCHHHMGLGFHI